MCWLWVIGAPFFKDRMHESFRRFTADNETPRAPARGWGRREGVRYAVIAR